MNKNLNKDQQKQQQSIPQTSMLKMGNLFFMNENNGQKLGNKLLRKGTLNPNYLRGQNNNEGTETIQTRESKSKTIDSPHKYNVDKSNVQTSKANFIIAESTSRIDQLAKDKKSKIYKQIDDIFQKDPIIQSKLNTQILSIQTPQVLANSTKYSKSKLDLMNTSDYPTSLFQLNHQEEYNFNNFMKTSSKIDNFYEQTDKLKIIQSSQQNQNEIEQQQLIKNDSNLIGFVQQQKLNMFVLQRPISSFKKSKNTSPDGNINDNQLNNNRDQQLTTEGNNRGQKYQQMIDGNFQEHLYQSATPQEKIRDKKESAASTQNFNSFNTHYQHTMTNQDTRSFTRNRQKSEIVQQTNTIKQTANSGLIKSRRYEAQASFSNLTQHQINQYYTTKKINQNSTISSQYQQQGSQNLNMGSTNSQQKQSLTKQNSITGISSKKVGNMALNQQQQLFSKINAKTVVSLAAMPEDDLDQEDEQQNNNKFFKDIHQPAVCSEDEEEDSEATHSKQLLSKSGNNNIDSVFQGEASIQNTDTKKLKIKINQSPVLEQQQVDDLQIKNNLSLLSLTDSIQTDSDQSSLEKIRSNSQSQNQSAHKKRRKSENQHQRRSTLKESHQLQKQDLKTRVQQHRQSINDMINQKKKLAAILIQQFWKSYKSGFQNIMYDQRQFAMGTGSIIENQAGATSILENNNNNNNNNKSNTSNIQNYNNSSNLITQNNQSTTLKFSNLQININPMGIQSNQNIRQKKISDGSFQSQLSVQKKPGLSYMQHLSPSPNKFQRSQHFFPPTINEVSILPQQQYSQQNISLQPVQYQNQHMPHQMHSFHRSASISSHKIMSFFTDPKKKKQAIEARKILNEIQIKPVIPLKFYLYQYQKGLSLWEIINFFAHFTVSSDDVFVTMKFELNVNQFKGMLPIKFKIGVQDMVNISQFKKATKWSIANLLLNFYFKSKNLFKKWELYQQNTKNSESHSFFLLLDGMEQEREYVRNAEEKMKQKYEQQNEKSFQFHTDSENYLEKDDIHISELVQLFERLSFFIPNYTLFTNKISGQVVEVIDTFTNQIGYGASNTSILDLSSVKHHHYERNVKELRIFKQKRKQKIRELSLRSQLQMIYAIDKKFHMITNPNFPDQTINLIQSQNKISSASKKLSTSCSIDDAMELQKQQGQIGQKQTGNIQNLNISIMKKNVNWQKDGSQNLLKFFKNESGIDSPLTPAKIFGRDQDGTINMAETQDVQGQYAFSQTSIIIPNNQRFNNSIQSLDLQSELMLEENSVKGSKEKENSLNMNFIKSVSSQRNLNVHNPIPSNAKRYSSIVSHSQQTSPQQNNQRSPQILSTGQLPLQLFSNMTGTKNGSRRSSLFFQKMIEQRQRENQSNQQFGNNPNDRQESFLSPKKSVGEDLQEYLEDNSIIPNFLETTPKNNNNNNEQAFSAVYPAQGEIWRSSNQLLQSQQYAPLSQSYKIQQKNQLSFFDDDNQKYQNDSIDNMKRDSEQLIHQDSNDSDYQLLLVKQQHNRLDISNYSPSNHLNEELIDTQLFNNSEQLRYSTDQHKPNQNFKRVFKKATTILEDNQEDALQQSAYQTRNHLQNSINTSDSKQIEDIREDEGSEIDSVDSEEHRQKNYKELIKTKNNIIIKRLKEINYSKQFHYFEPHNNNKNIYIPESYQNPFQQNQIIMKTIVKKNKEFYLAVLRINLESEQEQFIDIEKKDGVDVILQLLQFNLKGRWQDQMSLNLFNFIEEFFQSNDIDMLKPTLNEDELGENQEFQLNYQFQKSFKFNKSVHVQKQLQGKINIENCKVNLIQTNTYRRQLKLEKQLNNPYHNISQDNIIEQNHNFSQNELSVPTITTGTNLANNNNNNNIGDNLSRVSSQNTSHLIIQANTVREELVEYLLPKKRNSSSDTILIKDILEEQDVRPILQIIFQNSYRYESDNRYYSVRLDNYDPQAINSLVDFQLSKKEQDGIDSFSKKSVNFKNLMKEGGNRSSISLLSRILKVSAKLKQNVLKVERNMNQTSIDQNNEHVSRVNERTIVASGDIEVLEYYNTAKKIKLDKIRFMYQIRDRLSGYIQSIRIRFMRNKTNTYYGEGELNAVIQLENHLNQYGYEQVIIKGQEKIEKLINIIQYSQETQIPIFKFNLLHKNIGFFSRLYFNSYIEHNKDTHLNKFLQKYNEKDEALYDLLKNAKSLLKEPSYLQLFLTRIKLTLISNFLSSHKHEQNFLLTTYFNSQKCSQYCKIKDFGRAIIQTVVYATNPMFTSDKSVFICLHIFSKKMRNTYSKLIFTIEDIQHLISKEFTADICLQKDKIIKMVYLLSEKIVYFNSKQFANFKLPLSNLNKNSKKCKYDLLNSFDPTPEPLALTKSILTNKTLLSPVLRSQKVIYTCVKKITGHFSIITVRRYDILDYHCIEIYIPKNGRKWSTNIYQSDLWRFNSNFMENLFPFIYWEHQNVLEIIKSFKKERYLDFTRKYESDILVNPQKYIDKINNLQQDHNHKFYSNVNYTTQTKFKYEKYYEQYSNRHLPQGKPQRKQTMSQNSQDEKNEKQFNQNKSITSLKNIDTAQNIQFQTKGHQGRTLAFITDQNKDNNLNIPHLVRNSGNRQSSILKNSKSSIGIIHVHSPEEEQSQDIHQNKLQERTNFGRHQLQKQLTFNEFLKEKNYVATLNPSQRSSKDILEEDAQKNFYYSSYVFQKSRKVSFDQFSYLTKPNQFLKLFDKNQLEATDVLELKIWEKIINLMEVRVNEQGKLLVVIDTFKGLLKEILSTFIIHLRSEDNVQIQISIEKQPQKTKSKMLLYLHSPTMEESYTNGKSKKKKQVKQKRFSNDKNHGKNKRSNFQKQSKKRNKSSNESNNSDSDDDSSQNNSRSSSSQSSNNSSSSSASSSSSSSSYDRSPKVNKQDDYDDYDNNNKISFQRRTSDHLDEDSEDYFKQMKKKYEQEFLEKEMLGSAVSLYLEEAIKWNVFIRINFFEKLQTENEKLSMNLLLQQYFNENKNHLSQFTERFRSSNKKSAPRRVIQKPQTSQRKSTESKLKQGLGGGQIGGGSLGTSSILEKLKNKVSSFKNKNGMGENNATMMLQKASKSVMINSPLISSAAVSGDNVEYSEDDGDSKNNVFPENYCFVNSDFVAMASMIKNKVRENYLPSSLYEDEEYYLQQQKKQGRAFKHFENVLSANRVRRNTIAVVLADESPSNKPQQKIGKRSFLGTYQSDLAPHGQLVGFKASDQSFDKSINSSSLIKEEEDNTSSQNPLSSNHSIGQIMKKVAQLPRINTQFGNESKFEDRKGKNGNNVSFTSNDSQEQVRRAMNNSPSLQRLSGFNSRLKSILLAQPSYFSNIEEAVKFEPKVKINCDISIQRLIDPEQKNFIVMYRGVFTKKPLQMIAIYYKTSKRKFYAEIWNIKTQKKVKQKIKFKQICYQIPYVKQLLQLKQYSEIGRRIFLTFKNTLMISTYYLVNS